MSPFIVFFKIDSLSYLSQACCAGQFYVNLIPARATLGEGTSIEKMIPPKWAAGKSVVHFLD